MTKTLEFLKKQGKKLDYIQKTFLTEKEARSHCENFIGAAQVPLGIAGPIKVQSAKFPPSFCNAELRRASKVKSYFLPLATTEGALVASVNRGCKATRLSGGIKTEAELVGATRGPVFRVRDLSEGKKLEQYLQKNFSYLQKKLGLTDPHLHLLKIKSLKVGREVYLRLFFDTEEAMGMNMVTIATNKLAEIIKRQLGIDCLALSANFCIDKKASFLNFIEGRGKKVWAEVILKRKVIKEVLKTEATRIYQVWLEKCLKGSALAGSLGFNAHFANVIAALFLACGQDLAHVVEGSQGMTTAEVLKNGDLYFSIYLPSLMVGTVGGGTGLPCQKEALGILGLGKGEKGESLIFSQIVGAGVLAGEISLLGALAAGHLSQAHERWGRRN